MTDTTAHLGLPMIAPSQAQKHVTHNEAIQMLDALTQLVLAGVESETPPAVPNPGEVHALGAAPTGAWSGKAGMLAQWVAPAWRFLAPQEGWRGWDATGGRILVWLNGMWEVWTPELDNLTGVGIGASADMTNRLAVASDGVLFSHSGAGHRLTINKAAEGDTGSLLYQSGWTGHAELGLTGDTDFHLKVSMDGSAWIDALVVDANSGHVSGAAVQSAPTDITAGRLARADYAYGPGNLIGAVSQTAGQPTGAVIERGSNANGDYVRFADGTQICSQLAYFDSSAPNVDADHVYPASFTSPFDQAHTASIATPIGGANLAQLDELARGLTVCPYDGGGWRLRAYSYGGGDIGLVPFRLSAVGRWF
ncbi:DUF2793 domain-containing protein [Sulfitobacter sp. S0837]|uniref:DUF2793 domain-containing protein n=1 Tax=Sulfitobacter maritimus TaxID=2741719 RepID=UPI0015822282|nr:DUF2793 domain-containing protein [Sulfitobacter maritimus]NUH63868.1 DUF2793 domain-containing protein [Sulfitobacter maritimus]